MPALVIDEEARKKAEAVMAFARRHVWYPEDPPAANVRGYICDFGPYRCTFSYTKPRGSAKLFRHLSISDHPGPDFITAIAALFEFTGAEQGLEQRLRSGRWMIAVQHEEPQCVVLVEELSDE